MTQQKIVCWFSCGAASAVATKLTLAWRPDALVVRQVTGSEHPDNERFMADCENWFGKRVITTRSKDYLDTWDVWESNRYIAGVKGAPCTSALKRDVGSDFMKGLPGGVIEVFGFTLEEAGRAEKWRKNNPGRNLYPILIDKEVSKSECLGIIQKSGIELPEMYKLGYKNNNCIGCPKGAMGYWNKIRIDFPLHFKRMARLERRLNAAVCHTEELVNGKRKRIKVFLDELPENAGRYADEPDISCGATCEGFSAGLEEAS